VQWRMMLAFAETWSSPPFPVSGEEIKAAGVPEGPLVGRIRKEIESWWVDTDFTDDKLAAIERLKAVVQGLIY
jgi:poly(A) polymerase